MNNNSILKQNISVQDILSLVIKPSDIKSMELNAFINIYLKLIESSVRPDSIGYYKENLELVFRFFKTKGVYETKYINQELIDEWIKFSLYNNNKPITINKRMSVLKTALNRVAEHNLITLPNFKFTKLKETLPKIQPVKMEDIKLIMNQIDKMKISHQLMIYILIGTGIRRNELVNIKVENIN